MTHPLPVTAPLLAGLLALAACAAPPSRPGALPDAPVLLLGEQHDADEHQALARASVERLTAGGRLAALVIEMAEAGRDTRGLARDTSEAEVRQRLAWHTAGWPWERYGPTVMAAVQAGVPVVGGNLPRARMREAMQDDGLDGRLDAAGLARQRQAVDDGHCRLLPASQLPGMARIQIARDLSLAQTAERELRAGQTVLLLAGAGHVRRDVGVPRHWPAALAGQAHVVWLRAGQAGADDMAQAADTVWPTPPVPEKDHCAELRNTPLRR